MRQRWTRPIPALTVELEDAQRIVERAMPGARVKAVSPIEGGLANTNVKVSLDRAPGAVLLRLYQRDPTVAEKERAIAERLRGSVPVSQFLYLGDDGDQRVAILEWVDGERLEIALEGADARQIAKWGTEVGGVLARVH